MMLFSDRSAGESVTLRGDIPRECLLKFKGGMSRFAHLPERIKVADEDSSKSKLGPSDIIQKVCNQTGMLRIRVIFSHRLHGTSSCGLPLAQQSLHESTACQPATGNDLGAAAAEDWSLFAKEDWGHFGSEPDLCFRVSRLNSGAARVEVGSYYSQVTS